MKSLVIFRQIRYRKVFNELPLNELNFPVPWHFPCCCQKKWLGGNIDDNWTNNEANQQKKENKGAFQI